MPFGAEDEEFVELRFLLFVQWQPIENLTVR